MNFLDSKFSVQMLTNRLRSNYLCQISNKYWCPFDLGQQNTWFNSRRNFSTTTTKAVKLAVDAHASESWSYVGVGSCVGVHGATSSLHNLQCNSCIQHRGEGGRQPWPLPPNSPFLWFNVASGILRHPLTIAVKYKMALCDSFTGIKAHSRLLSG